MYAQSSFYIGWLSKVQAKQLYNSFKLQSVYIYVYVWNIATYQSYLLVFFYIATKQQMIEEEKRSFNFVITHFFSHIQYLPTTACSHFVVHMPRRWLWVRCMVSSGTPPQFTNDNPDLAENPTMNEVPNSILLSAQKDEPVIVSIQDLMILYMLLTRWRIAWYEWM